MASTERARTRGRPQTGSDDQRERIIDAARDLFASGGFAATTLRQVSLLAGVTPALAHYYFKDKSGLFDAVARERIAPLLAVIEAALEAHGTDAVAALAAFVQQFTLVASRHPWLPPLLMRDSAMHELSGRLQALVAAGQASGAIRSDLRAASIAVSVLSLCAFPFLLGAATDASTAPGMTLHHLAVLRDGLKPRARAAN